MPTAEVIAFDARSAGQPVVESNHRIANHLAVIVSLVQLKRNAVDKGPATLPSAEVSAHLQSIAGMVINVAHLHRTLAQQSYDQRIDLGQYLGTSCSLFLSSLEMTDRAKLREAFDADCFVSAERAQSIGLMVTEVLMNAIKYAHPTGIPVVIDLVCRKRDEQTLVIEISDDGIGLPENFNPLTDGGMGFKLIRALSQSAGAELSVESDSLGTTFRFVFSTDSDTPH